MSTAQTRFLLRLLTVLLFFFGVLLLRKPAFSQALAPKPTTQTITAAPTRFSVVIEGPAAGKAPDIILIPGLASSREDFAAEARLLAPNYRLHLIQIAGFSGQPAGPNANGPVLAPVVEQIHDYILTNHLDHPAIIGHSLGGLLAMMLAASHPNDPGKLLIVDTLPFYGLVFSPSATVDMLAPQAKAIHDSMLAASSESFNASSAATASMLVTDPAGLKIVQASSASSDRTVFANAMLEDLSTDLRPQLPSIAVSVTVLYPYQTAEASKAKISELYTNAFATLPNVKLTRIDDSRHFIMFDQPAAFHTAVLSFLK